MKTKTLFLLFLMGSLCMHKTSVSQLHKGNSDNMYKHAVGYAAGFTSGLGLSYRYMPSRISYQLAFLPYADESTKLYSLGITFLFTIDEGDLVNFFIYQGNHYWYFEDKGYNNEKDITEQWNNGIGFGFEYIRWERFSSNFMIGYAFYNNFKKLSLTAEMCVYYLLK